MVMRAHHCDITVASDIDLTRLASRRVLIESVGDGYRITTTFRMYRCERHAFVSRYLRRKMPGLKSISGNCSAPTGYFWT